MKALIFWVYDTHRSRIGIKESLQFTARPRTVRRAVTQHFTRSTIGSCGIPVYVTLWYRQTTIDSGLPAAAIVATILPSVVFA